MRKLFIIIIAVFEVLQLSAQEITYYEADSTAYYNALENPNAYSQSPTRLPQRRVLDPSRLHTHINMGTSFGSFGSSQYINPTIGYDASDRLQLFFGMGLMYSNLKLRHFSDEIPQPGYLRANALTNYYTVAASYQLSPRCEVYGSLIYAHDALDKDESPYRNPNRYISTFGATFNITQSLSIGIEIRNSNTAAGRSMFNPNPYFPGM